MQGQDAMPSTREDPIWISKREVRRTAPRSSGSKKTTYFIEFYLVDNHGYETLAATGEDQGAHNQYMSSARQSQGVSVLGFQQEAASQARIRVHGGYSTRICSLSVAANKCAALLAAVPANS
jgi:hypothetical protein